MEVSEKCRNAAIEYIESGVCAVPCRRDKKQTSLPKTTHLQKRLPTEEEVDTWDWPNVGIITGKISGLVVVDIDSDKAMATIKKRGLELPETPIFQRTSRGFHLFYAHPMDMEYKTKAGIGGVSGVDVRADGGFLAVHPSVIHEDDGTLKTYDMVQGCRFDELPLPPEWVLEPRNPHQSQVIDLSGVGRAPSWYHGESGMRNDSMFRLCCSLFSKGHSAEEVYALAQGVNTTSYTPPLQIEEVRRCIESASKYRENPLEATPQEEEGEVTEEWELDDLSAWRFYIAERKPREWLIPGLLPKVRVAILAGPGDRGKGWFSIQMGVAMACGTPFMDLEIENKRRVLIINPEEEFDDYVERFSPCVLRQVEQPPEHKEDLTKNLHIPAFDEMIGVQLYPADSSKLYRRIMKAVERYGKYDLIVLDPFNKLFSLEESNSQESATAIIKACDRLSKDTGATILITMHTNKEGAKNQSSSAVSVLGSVAFTNAARHVLQLEQLTEPELKRFGLEKSDGWRFGRLEISKGNYIPAHSKRIWFLEKSREEATAGTWGIISPEYLRDKMEDVKAEVLALPVGVKKSQAMETIRKANDLSKRATKALFDGLEIAGDLTWERIGNSNVLSTKSKGT